MRLKKQHILSLVITRKISLTGNSCMLSWLQVDNDGTYKVINCPWLISRATISHPFTREVTNKAHHAAMSQFINLKISATMDEEILTGPVNPPEQYAMTKTLACVASTDEINRWINRWDPVAFVNNSQDQPYHAPEGWLLTSIEYDTPEYDKQYKNIVWKLLSWVVLLLCIRAAGWHKCKHSKCTSE